MGGIDDVSRYRAEAEKAEQAAKRATTPGEREAYAKIAQGWRMLLEQRVTTKR